MEEMYQKIKQFCDERDWKNANNEKDIALSISLEANELLENFQWKSSEEAIAESRQDIKEEMADVLIYLVRLALQMDIDLKEAVQEKMIKNAIKYPVSISEV